MLVNFIVNVSDRQSWNGSFEVDNTSLPVLTENPTNIIFEPGTFGFNPTNFAYYSDPKYITWRTYLGSSQYPDSGYSFDIWSDDLYDDIISNATWDDLITTGTFNLNLQKNTLIYNYDVPGFPFDFYGKGGIITFG